MFTIQVASQQHIPQDDKEIEEEDSDENVERQNEQVRIEKKVMEAGGGVGERIDEADDRENSENTGRSGNMVESYVFFFLKDPAPTEFSSLPYHNALRT